MHNDGPECVHGTSLYILCAKCAEEKVEKTRVDDFIPHLTAGKKFDSEKPPLDLLDPEALTETANVLAMGAKKYGKHNWRKGLNLSRLIAAAMRHLAAINSGEDADEESGLLHAGHLMCCAMFIIWTMKHRPDLDDRYKPTEV